MDGAQAVRRGIDVRLELHVVEVDGLFFAARVDGRVRPGNGGERVFSAADAGGLHLRCQAHLQRVVGVATPGWEGQDLPQPIQPAGGHLAGRLADIRLVDPEQRVAGYGRQRPRLAHRLLGCRLCNADRTRARRKRHPQR